MSSSITPLPISEIHLKGFDYFEESEENALLPFLNTFTQEGRPLVEIPLSLATLSHLNTLVIRSPQPFYNNEAPENLEKLTNLTTLHLSQPFQFGTIHNLNLQGCLSLTSLSLEGLGLKTVPVGIENMPLERLSLRSNLLTYFLPPKLSTTLTSLDLGFNALEKASFGGTTSITYLNLKSNYLYELTFKINEWALVRLILRRNRFKQIPLDLAMQTALQYLDLSDNPFEDNVPLISLSTSLTKLKIDSANEGITLPASLEYLRLFKGYDNVLEARINKLTLQNITTLNLSSCELDRFPSISHMTSLTDLDISYNPFISEIPEEFFSLNIQCLNVFGNSCVVDSARFPLLISLKASNVKFSSSLPEGLHALEMEVSEQEMFDKIQKFTNLNRLVLYLLKSLDYSQFSIDSLTLTHFHLLGFDLKEVIIGRMQILTRINLIRKRSLVQILTEGPIINENCYRIEPSGQYIKI